MKERHDKLNVEEPTVPSRILMFQEEGEAEKPEGGAEETTGGGGTAGRRAGEERGEASGEATPCWPELKRLEMKKEQKNQTEAQEKQEGAKQQQVDEGVQKRRKEEKKEVEMGTDSGGGKIDPAWQGHTLYRPILHMKLS